MGVGGAFRAATAVLATLALVTSATLVLITTRLHDTADKMADAVQSVRAARELEANLWVYDHARRQLAAEAIDAESKRSHEEAAQRAEAGLHLWLAVARTYGESAGEAALVAETEAAIESHLSLRAQARDDEAHASLDRATALVDALVEMNVGHVQAARALVARWGDIANVMGVALACLMLGVVCAVLFGVNRLLYAPLVSIRDAIARFGRGDSRARAPDVAPRELADIARTFNETASALVRERERQLTFLAGVAHDLRNPLAALRAGAALLAPQRALPSEPVLRKTATIIERQIVRVDRMLEDLLDAAYIEAGQLELRLEERELCEVVRECVQLYEGSSSQEHEIILRLPAEPVRVRCDAARIAQVLNNLVSNALKYSPARTRVWITVRSDDFGAEVSVTDEGRGIPPEEVPHLFEAFRRGATTRESTPGVGLGLSVARRIVDAHHGRLEVESVVGEGSTFRLRLPR